MPMSSPTREEGQTENPTEGRIEKSRQSEPTSKPKEPAAPGTSDPQERVVNVVVDHGVDALALRLLFCRPCVLIKGRFLPLGGLAGKQITKLADFDSWKADGVYVKRGQDAITILEPGKEYRKDDAPAGGQRRSPPPIRRFSCTAYRTRCTPQSPGFHM